MTADRPVLRAVVGGHGAGRALVAADISPAGFDLDFVVMPGLPPAFRRMVRGLEFDICEMAISTYVCARAHGVPITALPIFPMRGFHHGAILVARDGGITTPKDLEGRWVGLERGYTVTSGVWARGILSRQYGVDLASIDWLVSGDEHVADYRPPANVHAIGPDRSITGMLLAGDLAAAIGIDAGHPDLVPLIPAPTEAALVRFREDGHYPINHLVVVRTALLDRHPSLALDLTEAFAAAKRHYLADLAAGSIAAPNAADRRNATLLATGADPLPYGIAPNRPMLEELVRHARDQRIIPWAMPVDDLFAPTTRDWIG